MRFSLFFITIALFFIATQVTGDTAQGKAIFDQSCKFCHGGKGFGNGILEDLFVKPPKELHPDKYDANYLKKKLKATNTTKGKMRHFTAKISNDKQLEAIAKYVSTSQGYLGKTLYRNSCQACHGSKANGRGIIVGFKKNPANLKAMASGDIVERTKGSRSKQIFLGRKIKHLRRVPTDDQLEVIISYINTLDD